MSDQSFNLRSFPSIGHDLSITYKYSDFLKQLQTFTFGNEIISQRTLSNDQFITSTQNKYFFYSIEEECSIKSKQILAAISDVRKSLGIKIFRQFNLIKDQILTNHLSTIYLKYLYGVFRIFSLEKDFVTRILIWIYSLCYGKYQNQSKQLKAIIVENSRPLVLLGLYILSIKNQKIQQKMPSLLQACFKRIQKKFKNLMNEFVQNQQQKNHEQAYEICRICECHISVNLMHSHLTLCEMIFQKKYLELKIQQLGKQFIDQIKSQPVEYDLLDSRADTKLFFDRVYSKLGQKAAIFQLKDDSSQIGQIIDQFNANSNELVYNAVELLKQYLQNMTTKATAVGYESDQGPRLSQKSKIKTSKFISRNSIKFSSSSLNPDSDGKNSSAGSQKQIRICDDSFNNRTSKSFYSLEDFLILKLLGKGAYSQVYLVKNINTSDLFAMKVVEVQSVDPQTLEALKKQQQIYKKISSQFAIKLFYSFCQENLHFFLLQYASGGNLRTLLNEQVYLEEDSARFYIANLILSIEELHQMKIIHRDLKPENIVIDEEGFLKLTDFNLAFMLTANKQCNDQVSKFFGSPDYISPEVIQATLKHHPSRDIWSLGVIAYEILIGVTPFTAMSVQEVFQNILQGQIQWPQVGDQQGMISENAKNFMLGLLQSNPFKRLGYNRISDLKSHPFFKGINWQNIRHHKPFFVPKRQNFELGHNESLKQKIIERKSRKKSQNVSNLGCIIRYDVLKSKSSLKAKSTRKSRFKLEKQLNQLKVLTSMDVFPPNKGSQRELHSLQNCLSESDKSNKSIERNSRVSIDLSHKTVLIHDEVTEETQQDPDYDQRKFINSTN